VDSFVLIPSSEIIPVEYAGSLSAHLSIVKLHLCVNLKLLPLLEVPGMFSEKPLHFLSAILSISFRTFSKLLLIMKSYFLFKKDIQLFIVCLTQLGWRRASFSYKEVCYPK
jgi:hypothetical protein